jgi:hypothetical protein
VRGLYISAATIYFRYRRYSIVASTIIYCNRNSHQTSTSYSDFTQVLACFQGYHHVFCKSFWNLPSPSRRSTNLFLTKNFGHTFLSGFARILPGSGNISLFIGVSLGIIITVQATFRYRFEYGRLSKLLRTYFLCFSLCVRSLLLSRLRSIT